VFNAPQSWHGCHVRIVDESYKAPDLEVPGSTTFTPSFVKMAQLVSILRLSRWCRCKSRSAGLCRRVVHGPLKRSYLTTTLHGVTTQKTWTYSIYIVTNRKRGTQKQFKLQTDLFALCYHIQAYITYKVTVIYELFCAIIISFSILQKYIVTSYFSTIYHHMNL
jgi:hypothetical protein